MISVCLSVSHFVHVAKAVLVQSLKTFFSQRCSGCVLDSLNELLAFHLEKKREKKLQQQFMDKVCWPHEYMAAVSGTAQRKPLAEKQTARPTECV